MIVGAYNLHLYCDSESHPYTGGENNPFEIGDYQTRAESYKAARKYGWEIGKDKAICPECRIGKVKRK